MTDYPPLRGALLVSSEVSGGGEQYLYRLYEGLRRQFSVDPVLIGSLPDWDESIGRSKKVGRSPKLTMRRSVLAQALASIRPLWKTLKLANASRSDFVHFQYSKEKLALPKFVKAPVRLWTEHGPLPTNFPPLGLRILRAQARHCKVIAVSLGVQESLAAKGIGSTVIANPLPDTQDRIPPERTQVKTVLYAGRLHPFKRVDLLFSALGDHPDWKILIAGDGPDESRLRAIAPANVEFLGRLGAIDYLLDSVNVVALPSGQAAREGSPMVVLEARAKGVPTIVARDCHAAAEAAQLGCELFEPTPTALASSATVAAKLAVKPLPQGLREERSTQNWLQAHWKLASSVSE